MSFSSITPVAAARLQPSRPICTAPGRYGEVIVVQGHGSRPLRWAPGRDKATYAGIDAPATAPTVAAVTTIGACGSAVVWQYVARVDVLKSGECYYAPPQVSFEQQQCAGGGGGGAGGGIVT